MHLALSLHTEILYHIPKVIFFVIYTNNLFSQYMKSVLTLRDRWVGGSENNVGLTLSVHFSNFDSSLNEKYKVLGLIWSTLGANFPKINNFFFRFFLVFLFFKD